MSELYSDVERLIDEAQNEVESIQHSPPSRALSKAEMTYDTTIKVAKKLLKTAGVPLAGELGFSMALAESELFRAATAAIGGESDRVERSKYGDALAMKRWRTGLENSLTLAPTAVDKQQVHLLLARCNAVEGNNTLARKYYELAAGGPDSELGQQARIGGMKDKELSRFTVDSQLKSVLISGVAVLLSIIFFPCLLLTVPWFIFSLMKWLKSKAM